MGRTILAVVAGAAVWAVLWLVGTTALAAAFPDIVVPTEPLEHVPTGVFLIVFGAALSVLAGYTTAAVGGARAMGAVWALAALQLALGLYFEITNWALLPVWYHVIFLLMIVPTTVYGGRLRIGRAG